VPTVLLTAPNVRTLPAVGGLRTDYRDTLQPGLELRVTAAGHRSYAVAYYRGRRHRRFTIGAALKVPLAKARAQAKRILARATLGEDPQAEKVAARQASSVKGLGDAFLTKAKERVRPSTLALWTGILGHRVYPKLGSIAASEVTRADVRRLVEGIAIEAPVMANRTLQLLRAVYTWAVGRDLVRGSPCVGIERPAHEEPSDRVLSPKELVALMAALATTNDEGADVVWLLLYTGVRLRMVTGMRSEELEDLGDERRALWTVPGGYHGRSKNRRAHQVPLVKPAIAIIRRRLELHGDGLVFPNTEDGRRPLAWRSAFVELLRDRTEQLHGAPVPTWTIHNLRHTMRTHLREQLSVSDDVAELILGHVRQGIAGVYNRAELLSERRAALKAWASWLVQLRTGGRGKLLAMGTRSRRGMAGGDTRGRSAPVEGDTTSDANEA